MERKTVTEINEQGFRIPSEKLHILVDDISSSTSPNDIVVLSGSLPRECPSGFYANLIHKLNKLRVRCVLDADGEALRLGAQKGPYLIKSNLNELAILAGSSISSHSEIKKVCMHLIQEGIAMVVVSLGSRGAILARGDAAFIASPIKVDVKSTVGAGDSMVAGIIKNIDSSPEEALRAGVAAATASITQAGTRVCTKALYDYYYPLVEITRL